MLQKKHLHTISIDSMCDISIQFIRPAMLLNQIALDEHQAGIRIFILHYVSNYCGTQSK